MQNWIQFLIILYTRIFDLIDFGLWIKV